MSPIKAVLFDFMGTCLDWHTAVTAALPSDVLDENARSKFALKWRQAYFDECASRTKQGLAVESIDVTHRRTLEQSLETSSLNSRFDENVKRRQQTEVWHSQPAWPDTKTALQEVRAKGFEVFVHANGTMRLQLDLVKFSGLQGCFDMLLSSSLLGVYKPKPESYLEALNQIQVRPAEAVMVAAHAYDLHGAKVVGMKTIYIYRWTDDINEDQEQIRKDVDVYLDGMAGLPEALEELSRA